MIICTPKNILTPKQKELITKKGLVLIECDEPDKVRVINTETNIDTNDFFMAALFAMTTTTPSYKQEFFINELYKRLKEKER